jgi:hypothetical protein
MAAMADGGWRWRWRWHAACCLVLTRCCVLVLVLACWRAGVCVWRVACGAWRVACGVVWAACGVWRVASQQTAVHTPHAPPATSDIPLETGMACALIPYGGGDILLETHTSPQSPPPRPPPPPPRHARPSHVAPPLRIWYPLLHLCFSLGPASL